MDGMESGDNSENEDKNASELDDNISRSYVILEDDGTRMVDQLCLVQSLDVILDDNVSKSYIVTDNNDTSVLNELGHNRSLNVEEADKHKIDINYEDKINPSASDQINDLHSPNISLVQGNHDSAIPDKDGFNSVESIQDDEHSPPSLKSIKSIVEERKSKILEKQKCKSSYLQLSTNGESNTEINQEVKTTSKSLIPKAYLKKNEGRYAASKIPKKNITATKKIYRNNEGTKSSPKRLKSDPNGKSLHPVKEDSMLSELQHLHILNEKERKKSLKICQNLMSSQRKWKFEKERICLDYEKKIEDLKKKVLSLEMKNEIGHTSAEESSDNEKFVPGMTENDIRNLQKQLKLQETLLTGLQQENESLYNDLKNQDIVKKDIASKIDIENKQLLEKIETLKMNQQVDIERLQKKLKWYAENQALIDRDMNEVKQSKEDIKELRTLVARLEEESKKLRNENTQLKKELDSKTNQLIENRLQKSEKHIYTKSNPDPIIADFILPVEKKITESIAKEKGRPVHAYLEKRVKTLENELEEKDGDNAKKIRAIEQKYSSLSMEYEEHVRQLETKIAELSVEKISKQSYVNLESKVKDDNIAMQNLKKQIEYKDLEISALNLKIIGKPADISEENLKTISFLQKQVIRLKQKLIDKDGEINELRSNILLLQKDRTLLTQELQSQLIQSDSEFLPDVVTAKKHLKDHASPSRVEYCVESNPKYSAVLQENNDLKNNVAELQLEAEQKRLKYEVVEVKSQNEIRNIRETYDEERTKIEEKYRHKIEKLKMEFVFEHSNSKIAELNGKVQSYELEVHHLKTSLEEAKVDRCKFVELKITDESLRQQICQLQKDLLEGQQFHTPEVHHYKMLQGKINSMEKNHYTREEKLQKIIEKTKMKSNIDIETIEDKWRDALRKKDVEIENFREQLNGIIEVLQELQRQGVILTKYEVNLPT